MGSGEIFIIFLFILIFFGAEKIPEFARMMGKGMREFRKATDDLKRELNDNTSGVMDEVRSMQNNLTSMQNNLTESLTRDIVDPLQKTVTQASKTFETYQDQYPQDYYYDDQNSAGSYGNEYQQETQSSLPENTRESVSDVPVAQTDANEIKPAPKTRTRRTVTSEAKPKAQTDAQAKPKSKTDAQPKPKKPRPAKAS